MTLLHTLIVRESATAFLPFPENNFFLPAGEMKRFWIFFHAYLFFCVVPMSCVGNYQLGTEEEEEDRGGKLWRL